MKKTVIFILLVLSFVVISASNVSMTGSPLSYSQNFNTLPTSGTINWSDGASATPTISGWFSQRTGTGISIVADTGTSNIGNLFNYGSAAVSDRALGSLGSSGATAGNFAHGVLLKNDTGSIVSSISIAYTGEQWRNSAAIAQTISFFYKTSSAEITSLNPNNNTTWTPVTSLNFVSPITGGTAGALAGNASANRTVISTVSINSLNLAAGSYIMLKWDDPDHTGNDHGLAIDDVTVSWIIASAPLVSVSTSTLTGFTYVVGNGPSSEKTFTVGGSYLTSNINITSPIDYEISLGSGVTFSATNPITLTPVSGSVTTTTINTRLKAALSIGNYDLENVSVTSELSPQNVSCSGSVTAPPMIINVTGTFGAFSTTVGSPSSSQSVTVAGSNLTDVINIAAVTGYEYSTTNSSPWTSTLSLPSSFSGSVYVRLTGAGTGTFDGTIAVTSTGATTVNLTVAGVVTEVPTPMNIQAGTTLTRNFDDIGMTSIAPLPTDWKADKISTVRATGTYSAALTTTDQSAGNGMLANASNGIYNYGAGLNNAATDRAIGFISSSSATKSGNLYTRLTNTGLLTIGSYDISYNAEKYRTGTNAAGFSIKLFYSTDGATWTAASTSLNATWPADATTLGYDPAPGDTKACAGYITVPTAAAGYLYLCWNYSVSSGTTTSFAQALGIDDVVITAHPENYIPPTIPTDIGSGVGVTITYTSTGNGLIYDNTWVPNAGTPILNPAFSSNASFSLTGTGTITFTVTTSSAFGAYWQSGQWNTVAAVGGVITFTINFDGKPEIPIILGDGDPTLPVELSSFTAIVTPQNYVRLDWITQSETGVSGYYLYRNSISNLNGAQVVSPLITASNTSLEQSYSFTDSEVLPGTYYYWLQNMDMDGQFDFHGPIYVTLNDDNGNTTPIIPLLTSLQSIYPNPFNPTATISFGLAKAEQVNIQIYNIRGEKVRSFLSGAMNSGTYRRTWDGTDDNGRILTSGVYYIKMTAGKYSSVQKAILMK